MEIIIPKYNECKICHKQIEKRIFINNIEYELCSGNCLNIYLERLIKKNKKDERIRNFIELVKNKKRLIKI